MEYEYENNQDWKDRGHTKTTSMTSMTLMSNVYDEGDLDIMINDEDEPTTHSFDHPRISCCIHVLEKQVSSPFEHPLAGRVQSGIRKPKDMMNRASKKKQVEGAMLLVSSNVDNHVSARIMSGLEQQKRCRDSVPFEPVDKECVEMSTNDVLLGQGVIVYSHHDIQGEQVDREYKRLKIDVRKEAHDGNPWLV